MAAGGGPSTEATNAAVAKAESGGTEIDQKMTREWRVIAETVPGASHIRAGKPNQDAVLQIRESSIGLPLIVSVSDGHGSDKCFRSDRGSRLAVAIGSELLRETLNLEQKSGDAAQFENRIREVLPSEFAQRWKKAVEIDIQREPFTLEELNGVEEKDGAPARRLIEERPLIAYGATALVVGMTSSAVVYLQLGDGEIIKVSQTGEVSKPLPSDEKLIANETTSLCTRTASEDFRIACESLSDPPPALILMTTDGYANSFADEPGFLKVGSDMLEMLRTDGFDAVNSSVKGWLEEATRAGSGDDCTLAIICHMAALENPQSELTKVANKVAATELSTAAELPVESSQVSTESKSGPEQKESDE